MDYLTDDRIVKLLSIKYGMDIRVVRAICHSPFKFLKAKMEDMFDWRPVRLRYFGIFGLTKKAKEKYGELDREVPKDVGLPEGRTSEV